jgi:cytochrome c553
MQLKFSLKISVIVTFVALFFVAISCTTNEEKTAIVSQTTFKPNLAKGFQALNSNCFSCHSANQNPEIQVAPTIAELKTVYAENYTTEAEFTNAIAIFMQMPSVEKSKMPEAVQEYGLMPKMDFSEETVKNIAHYLFHTKIENSDWFANSYEKEKEKYSTETEPLSYQEKGLKYAMATKAVLGKNLLNAIKTRGTENAVAFCNTKAIHLTDSMANDLTINIKRVSDKNRNPENAANETELKYIISTKNKLAKGEKSTPQVQALANKVIAYYPIMMNEMCLQCHGKREKEINLKTQKRINLLYPEDKAVGYGANELRGIWVVEMKK